MTQDGFEWTEEQKNRARQVLESDARALNDTDPTDRFVSPSECSQWRKEVKAEGGTPVGVDAEFDTSTVESHVRGECRHTPAQVGIPARFNDDLGAWVGARMVSTGSTMANLDVYHTGVCRMFPESVGVLEGVDWERYGWRECRECSGWVPEAGPVPEARE